MKAGKSASLTSIHSQIEAKENQYVSLLESQTKVQERLTEVKNEISALRVKYLTEGGALNTVAWSYLSHWDDLTLMCDQGHKFLNEHASVLRLEEILQTEGGQWTCWLTPDKACRLTVSDGIIRLKIKHDNDPELLVQRLAEINFDGQIRGVKPRIRTCKDELGILTPVLRYSEQSKIRSELKE